MFSTMLDSLPSAFSSASHQRCLFSTNFDNDCHEDKDTKDNENDSVPVAHEELFQIGNALLT